MGLCLPGKGESSTFWPSEGTKGKAAPLLPSDTRAPATPPKPSQPPAAAPHSARQKAGVIKATSDHGEHNSARSLLIGVSQAHGMGLSIAPFFLEGAVGGGCRVLCQRSQQSGGGHTHDSVMPPQAEPPSLCRHLPHAKMLAFQSEWHCGPVMAPLCGVRSWEKTSAELGAGRDVAFQP